jgi:hypothetical protein
MKTTSNFAILDVKRGRATLRNLVKDHKHKIPVTLTGYITGDRSGDDGTSIEFEIQVTSHLIGKPIKIKCECQCIRCRCAPSRNGQPTSDRSHGIGRG